MTTEERFTRIEQNLAEASERIREASETIREADERIRHLAIIAEQNEQRAVQMMDTFNRMGRILQIHEQRIDSLEGRRPA